MDPDIRDRLAQLGAAGDDDIPLADAALALAALDRPLTPLQRYRDHLDQLACEVAALQAAGTGAPQALSTVIAGHHGYGGDTLTYDDLQNASLIRVIDRRKGLPVALGIIYMDVGLAQGWQMTGLNFPGHFLVRLDDGGDRHIVDAFHGGRIRRPDELRDLLKTVAGKDAELSPEHFAPVSRREVLLRLQNNIKLRHLRQQRLDDALAVIDAMSLIAPDEPWLWRECGLLNAHLGNRSAAISALERFRTQAAARGLADRWLHEAAVLVQQMKQSLN